MPREGRTARLLPEFVSNPRLLPVDLFRAIVLTDGCHFWSIRLDVVTKHMKVYRDHVATPNGRSLTIEYRNENNGWYSSVSILNQEGQLLLIPPQDRLSMEELTSLMEELMGCESVHIKETLRAN